MQAAALRAKLTSVNEEREDSSTLLPWLVLATGIAAVAVGTTIGIVRTLDCDDSCTSPFWPSWLLVGGAAVSTAGLVWLQLAREDQAELESRRKLVHRLMLEYPHIGQLAALGRLPEQTAELAALCLQRWRGELRVPDSPATCYVLANMLLGACVSQMLRPAAQISTAAMLDAMVEIVSRVLQPQAQLDGAFAADAAE